MSISELKPGQRRARRRSSGWPRVRLRTRAPPRHWYADALRGVLPVSTAESEVGEAMSWPQVPPLAELHSRRSEKWDGYDPDVVVATIAEMDFCLDPSIAAALHSAIDRHDLGYAHERIRVLAEAPGSPPAG